MNENIKEKSQSLKRSVLNFRIGRQRFNSIRPIAEEKTNPPPTETLVVESKSLTVPFTFPKRN